MNGNTVYHGLDPEDKDDPVLDDDRDRDCTCPACGEDDYEYVGELYDDEEHIGSQYRCNVCGHEFSESDGYED